ncbi:MAG: hypothetical protein K0Q55_2252 [Verrucomicrobia bacterium]|nr:hypothetical protein [Verrucomicrobiota bacterium]
MRRDSSVPKIHMSQPRSILCDSRRKISSSPAVKISPKWVKA